MHLPKVPNSLLLGSLSNWGLRYFLHLEGYSRHRINKRLSVNCGFIIDLPLPYCDTLGKPATCFSIRVLMVSSGKWKSKARSLDSSKNRASEDKGEEASGWLAGPQHVDLLCTDVLHVGLKPWWVDSSLCKTAIVARQPGTTPALRTQQWPRSHQQWRIWISSCLKCLQYGARSGRQLGTIKFPHGLDSMSGALNCLIK